MEYLTPSTDYQELGQAWDRYQRYLRSVEHSLPPEVFQFASAEWHYDPSDHRSLHDSWVEALAIRELPASNGSRVRRVTIEVELLPPYHDGKTTLVYEDVTRYDLMCGGVTSSPASPAAGHGDWVADEVRLSQNGSVLHEVLFSSGARWLIECATVRHTTTAPGPPAG